MRLMADVFNGVPQHPGIDGAELLDETEAFLGRFVAYPSEAARIAHTLWVAHTLHGLLGIDTTNRVPVTQTRQRENPRT